MKKLFALILSVLMVCSLATVAFADDTPATGLADGEILISNSTVGKDYTLYKLFDATYGEDAEGNVVASYSIKPTDPNFAALFGATAPHANSHFDVFGPMADGSYQVTTTKTEAEILYYLQNDVPALAPVVTITATENTVKFTGVTPGYYFITTTNGTTVTITNVNPSAEVIDKNQVPTGTEKEVAKLGTGAWQGAPNTDNFIAVEYNETYEYRLTIGETPNYYGAEPIAQYFLVDTYGTAIEPDLTTVVVNVEGINLTKGLCIHPDGTIVRLGSDEWKNGTEPNNSAEFFINHDSTNRKFKVTVPFMAGYTLDADNNVINGEGDFIYDDAEFGIIVTYNAVLTELATVGNGLYDPNKNTVETFYQHEVDDGYATEDIGTEIVYVKTYGQGITKVDGVTKAPLQGVEFMLYADRNYTIPVGVVQTTVPGVYMIDRDAAGEVNNLLVTPANGKIVILGMDTDEYFLRESKALPGYNLPNSHFLLKADVTKMGEFTTLDAAQEEVKYTVHIQNNFENNKGALLPETGAMGTVIFTTLGSLVALVAVVFMITRKKMVAYED